MPTASIYYHRDTTTPDFVLIDGAQATVHQADYGDAPDLAGARIRAVDHACRRLGWKVVDAAAIVRQADGRATIRIEPVSPPTGRIVSNTSGMPRAVIVGDRAEAVHTMCSLTSSLPGNSERAEQAVRVAFAAIGYSIVGSIPKGGWNNDVEVVADADLPDMTAGSPAEPDEWRDVPTMVRIDDDTARALNDMSKRLGIPGDQLAAEWIRRCAVDARARVDRWTSDDYIEDPRRITGWHPDGTPRLKD